MTKVSNSEKEEVEKLFQTHQPLAASFFDVASDASFYFAGYLIGAKDLSLVPGFSEVKNFIIPVLQDKFDYDANSPTKYSAPDFLVQHPLFRHFLRGYLESGGKFTYYDHKKRPYPQTKVIFSVCEEFGENIMKYLNEQLGLVKFAKIESKKEKDIFNFVIKLNEYSCPVLEFLYDEALTFLPTKQLDALNMYCDHDNRVIRQLSRGAKKINYKMA